MRRKKRKSLGSISRKALSGLLCVMLTVTSASPVGMQVLASELQTETEQEDLDEQNLSESQADIAEISEESSAPQIETDEKVTEETETQMQSAAESIAETEKESTAVDETSETETQSQISENNTAETGKETEIIGTETQTETVETETQSSETETQTEVGETETQTQDETDTEETDTEETETEGEEDTIDAEAFEGSDSNAYISYVVKNNTLTITVKANNKPYSDDGRAPWEDYIKEGNIKSVLFKGTGSLSDISYMFQGLTDLESVDFSGFKSTNLTNIKGLFYGCSKLKEIKNLNKLSGAKVTDMSYAFYDCSSLSILDLSQLTTSGVTNMSSMFSGCSSLSSVTFGGNTAKVTDMSSMFSNCYSLNNLDLSKLNTSSVTNMTAMFSGCSSLNNVTFGGSFNTAKVVNMSSMFYGSGLNTMDLSKLNTVSVTNMAFMFSSCRNLNNITFGGNTAKVENMASMFSSCRNLNNVDLTKLDTSNVTTMRSMFSACTNLDNITFGGVCNNAKVTDMSSMFSGCTKLDNWDFNGFNTSSVTNMTSMFSGCTGMKELDLTPLNTDNVQLMNSMFYNCTTVTKLILDINTNNATNMSSMFANCYQLNDIIFGDEFNSTKVLNMSAMFSNCRGLKTLDLSKFNVVSATNMQSMFYGCSGLTTIDLTSFDAISVLNTSHMFENCTSLKTLDLSTFNADSVTNMSYMFNNCTSLETLDLTSFKKGTISDMSYMLYNCSSLRTVDLSDFNTSSTSNMRSVFHGCSSLKSLDLSSFDTGKVTIMSYMFSNCSSMTELILDAEKFTTGNVLDMSYTFSGCNRLEYVDTSKFDTAKVTTMQSMFSDCNSLNNLDVSSFNTSNVINMREMFSRCNSLKFLDVSKFDTSKITDMYGMFFLCINLVQLDVSNFNTQQVTNMRDMFYSCRNLNELDLSNFDAAKVTDVWNMLSECVGLKVIYTPLNLGLVLSLPKDNPNDKWYRSGGDSAVVAMLPQDLDYSIMLIKNKSFEYPCIIAQKTKTQYNRGENLTLDDLIVTYYDISGNPTVLAADEYSTNEAAIDMRKFEIQELIVTYRNEESQELTDSIELTITGKIEVTISGIEIDSVIYNAEMVSYQGEAVVKIKDTDEIVPDGDITLMYGYGGTLADGTAYPYAENGKPPIDAGSYLLVVAVAEDNPYYTGQIELPFEINKAPVTITADDIMLTVNSEIPEKYDYKVEGLFKEQTLNREPSFECVVDMSKAGVYDINPIDADAGLNYEISYQKGTFTVTDKNLVEIAGIKIDSFTYNAEPAAYSGEVVVKLAGDNGKVVTQEAGKLIYTYSGTLKDGTLYADTDKAPIDAGDYTLMIEVSEENEKYMGMVQYSFEIRKAPLAITADNMMLDLDAAMPEQDAYTYKVEGFLTERTLDKAPSFKCNANTSREGSYYIVPYDADAGVNYEIIYNNGTLTVRGAGINVEEIPRQVFTGKPIKPEVRVFFEDGTLLKAGKDYTIKYFNNINADTALEAVRRTDANRDGKADDGFTKGMAYVVVTGKGNYTGTVYRNFYIDPAVISEDGINEAAGFKLKYKEQLVESPKKAQKFFQSIKYKKAMKLNVDYTLALTAENAYMQDGTPLSKEEVFLDKNVSAVPANCYGTFKMTLEGINNYKGILTRTIYVTDKSHLLKNATITLGKNLKKVNYVNEEQGVRLTPAYYDTDAKIYYVTEANGSKTESEKDNVFTVKIGKKYLEYGAEKDFTIDYIDNNRVGTATMIITGKGMYMGTKSIKFKIVGTAFNAKTVQVDNFQESMPYTATSRTQENLKLTDSNGNPILESCYTISYKNNINKGTATMILTANTESGYSGSIKKTFKITAADMASAVSVIPVNTLEDSVEKRGEGGIYHLNSVNVYSASGVKPSKKIRLIIGSEQEPSAVLTEGKDYTVKYTNNSSVSASELPTMTITGKGNYAGTLVVTFGINKAELSQNANLAVIASAVSYNAKKTDDYKYQPKINIKDGKKTLKAGKDYVVERYEHCSQKEVRDYLQAKEDGTSEKVLQAMRPYVVIAAAPDSCYSGTIEADLTIYKIKLTAKALYVVITDDPEQTTYTGEQLKPDVTVYYGDPKAVKEARNAEITADRTLTSPEGKYKLIRLKLKEGQNNGDYTLTYGNNIKAGKKAGSITVNGTGLYGGKVTVKFMIQGEDVFDSTVEPWSAFTEKLKLIFAQ